ncbi:Fic family protein [Balneolales bacterium ANBcel1]|nr:Fic family protein [Balneolales bacterium ANBcel1]
MPKQRDQLRDKAVSVVRAAAALGALVHPELRKRLGKLTDFVSCYYSNVMEGRQLHPKYIEQAFQGEFQSDAEKRSLQLLSRAHVKIRQFLDQKLVDEPGRNICNDDFVAGLHAGYFRRVPKEFREFRDPDSGKFVRIAPGEQRTNSNGGTGESEKRIHDTVTHGTGNTEISEAQRPAGKQDARSDTGIVKDSSKLTLHQFSDIFNSASFHGADILIAAAASHYHFMRMRPFAGGNGQIARFVSHAWLKQAQADAGGLWTISRGLARNREAYMDFFGNEAQYAGEQPTDPGQTNSSKTTRQRESLCRVTDFCHFYLNVCLDEIRFVHRLLDSDALLPRMHKYVSLRSAGMVDQPELRDEARFALEAVMLRGAVPRGEMTRITGLGERTARNMISRLLDEGLLESDSHRAPLRLGIPIHAAGWWFPGLYPEGML